MAYRVTLTALRPLSGDYGAVGEGQDFTTTSDIAAELEASGMARRRSGPAAPDVEPSGRPAMRPPGDSKPMPFSVIIPSRTQSNLAACCWGIVNREPDARVLVVDDGVAWSGWEKNFWPRPMPTERVAGIKPFIFSRNVNLGIKAAGTDDVIILNDDAILQTPGGFSLLARAAAENPEYGLISAAGNHVGNPAQHRREGGALRAEPRIVCFVAVLIPRSTIERVGLLDERFGGVDARGRRVYGFEDDDYCLRARRAGLKIGIHDGCYVDHGSLKSTFRAHGPCPLEPGRDLFIEKWGRYPL